MMQERLKRMKMRSWRRGTKEMDLVLGPYADAHLEGMSAQELDGFEAILAEQDQDLMAWILGHKVAPDVHLALLARLLAFAEARKGKI
ncbi:succinate dehydrogenase assembly factor 2 [Rhodobacter sp. KR11]|uniref:FAD assembly factor SdhE n=1 Tax=Rhodobacter sp. KR11 TaxID=2974588 RepID=UPI002222646F|nr:succinate dehydrogenase assembly factor 2 [Rhodobacter sp. KR11]MCW1919653.1 succinate dehydrogenase assembly factor 2 [Rhodobacter sp. KR11]